MDRLSDSDIVIGTVLGPFGNRGEVKIKVLTDFPQRFAAGSVLDAVLPNGSRASLRVISFREHKNVNVALLEGCTSRSEAADLRGADFVIDRSDVEELPEDSFYIYEIIGCNVVTDDGRELGVVKEVLQPGSNDVYITSSGVCVPALKDVVISIDIETKQIVIHPMPGMLAD